MSQVSLVHTSGGLIGDALVADLRQPAVAGDAAFLADPATFTDRAGDAPTRAHLEGDLTAAFHSGQALWSAYADELAGGMDTGRLREKLLLPLLGVLGFQPVYERARTAAGNDTWGVTHLGWDSPDAPPLLLVPARSLDDRDGGKRSPHEELQGYLNAEPAKRWGLASNGVALRIVRDYHHTRSRGYIEFDLAAIFEAASYPDFLALWRLVHASRFQPTAQAGAGGQPTEPAQTTLLERLYDKALTAGVAAGKRLQPQVRRAVELLANGLLDNTPELRTRVAKQPDLGRDLYRELLTVLYRILFLLFAEQRGMLTSANELYNETYSITGLRARAEAGDAEPGRRDLWDGLKATFRAFSDPDLAKALAVYPYNGRLFDLDATPLTTEAICNNQAVMTAVSALTTMPVGKVQMHVDYRNLGVEELGTVYESLLDYTLQIADTPLAVDGRSVRAGQAYLAALAIERSDLASYYTPTDLVDLLLARSLDPLLDDRLTAAGDDRAARERALLDLKVIDPACGSGAILVGALDRIALALARTRSAPAEPTDQLLAHARRDVLQHSIYGADKDPFAVELAKVTLWIHCVVPDQPLSFLDAHIVCGDSLVGWPLLNLPSEIPQAAYEFAKASKDDKKVLAAAKAANKIHTEGLFKIEVDPDLQPPRELLGQENTYLDVRAKTAAFETWRHSPDYRRWKQAADLWTAAFFWTADFGDAPTTADYLAAVEGSGSRELADAAATVLEDLNPLHWPLAFPDVRSAGGFDLVLGNPPWEQYRGDEREFFAQAAPHIAAMTSETRTGAVRALADHDPDLFHRWRIYQALQSRLSHYAKSSGRFTRTSGEVNTYILFIEAAAEMASHTALIVKSGIATDAAQTAVWRRLVESGRVSGVYDIVNAGPGSPAPVFPAVAAPERFSLLVLRPAGNDTMFPAAMLNFGVAAARDSEPRIWTLRDLEAVAPRSRTLLSSASLRELDLAVRLQSAFDTLDFASDGGTNSWSIGYHTLFHSSGAKREGLLLRPDALRGEGYHLGKNKVFRHGDGSVALPVYEGQMANRWDHRARTFEGYRGDNKYGAKPGIPWVTEAQHADPAFEVEPRYWMRGDVAAERIKAVAGDRPLLCMRDIGRPWNDRRNMRVAVFPRYPATDGLPILSTQPGQEFALAALLNSMTFDFLVRLHMSSGNLSGWVFDQVAAPPPAALPAEMDVLAATLSVTSEVLAKQSGRAQCAWDSSVRPLIDARLDALVARAYGLSRAEYEIVLDHFDVLRRMEQVEVGEYRSKRLRLDAFGDLMGEK